MWSASGWSLITGDAGADGANTAPLMRGTRCLIAAAGPVGDEWFNGEYWTCKTQ
jgi:hypothetical protein